MQTRWPDGGALAAALILIFALAGCATGLDPGSNAFNLAAERSRNGELLLNIVRASLGRPLTFTALQTISGAGFSGESTFDIPIVQNHADMAFSLERKFRGSAQPSFTVGVLDTQEFYRGVLAPLNLQTLDLYVKRGLSRPLLMDLFFSEIDVTAADSTDPLSFQARFRNDPAEASAFADYQGFSAMLLAAGLTTQAVVKPGGAPDYILCFQPDRVIEAARDQPVSTCQIRGRRADPSPADSFSLDLGRASPELCALLNRRRARGAPLDCSREADLSLTFALRSTYEIIQYAGVAMQQSQRGQAPTVVDAGRGEPLMLVRQGQLKEPFAAVHYAGRDYAIPGDGADLGPTLQTVQLLTELMALNRSAKDLPASSLTVVSP